LGSKSVNVKQTWIVIPTSFTDKAGQWRQAAAAAAGQRLD